MSVGDVVFVEDPTEAWLPGVVEAEGVRLFDGGMSKKKGVPAGQMVDSDVENLIDLDSLTEGSILHHVRRRFRKGDIYTAVGSILVAVNPFERLPQCRNQV